MPIKAEELVVGDIVEVKFGDRIPADIRVLEARSFKVSRSVFNGGGEWVGWGCPHSQNLKKGGNYDKGKWRMGTKQG